ncbi:MAG TPA: hypothetical protein VLW75_04485, partial [Rhizomicrobium sp.]|nr:hypothetical protein [Rhizomicrobium sp.]
MANVTAVMPSANTQTPNTPATPAAGIDALFAAMLAHAETGAAGMPAVAAGLPDSVLPAPLPADPAQTEDKSAISQMAARMAQIANGVDLRIQEKTSGSQNNSAAQAAPEDLQANDDRLAAPISARVLKAASDSASPDDPAVAFAAPANPAPTGGNTDDAAALPQMPVPPAAQIFAKAQAAPKPDPDAALPRKQVVTDNAKSAQRMAVAVPQQAVTMAAQSVAASETIQPQTDGSEAAPKAPAARKTDSKQTAKIQTVFAAMAAPFVPQAGAPAQRTSNAAGDVMSAPKPAEPAPQTISTEVQASAPQTKPDLSAAAESAAKPAPAPQATEAQALPLQFNLASGGQNAQTNSGNAHHQTPQQTAQAPQPVQSQSAPAPSAPIHASAAQPAGTANSPAQTAQPQPTLTVAPAPQAPVPMNAQIHVGAQNNSAPMAYDVSAIAVSVAQKWKDDVNHFDIRLDP